MRHAIYYTPPEDDPLTLAAEEWLGRSVFGRDVPHACGDDEVVVSPRRYGFHGTLKAPFRLREGAAHADMVDRFTTFCAEHRTFVIPELVLARLGSFFALVPANPVPALEVLAGNAVEAFEPFRSPLKPSEIARRKPERLNKRQQAHLERWGYPYVFDEFRFHLTLTGPVPDERCEATEERLRKHFADHLGKPRPFNTCALFVEKSENAPFEAELLLRLSK